MLALATNQWQCANSLAYVQTFLLLAPDVYQEVLQYGLSTRRPTFSIPILMHPRWLSIHTSYQILQNWQCKRSGRIRTKSQGLERQRAIHLWGHQWKSPRPTMRGWCYSTWWLFLVRYTTKGMVERGWLDKVTGPQDLCSKSSTTLMRLSMPAMHPAVSQTQIYMDLLLLRMMKRKMESRI